jgi:hypothetical protein
VPYNGIDKDCNPMTWDDELDQDGFALEDDCDDNDAAINADAEDIPNNGIDENCDGEDTIVSAKELLDESLQIYPNPTTGLLNILIPTQ